MTSELYQKNLLKLASMATNAGRLPSPDATFTLDNPLCGDRVTFDLTFLETKILDIAHEVKGCVLCQASASMLASNATGESVKDIKSVREKVRKMLEDPDSVIEGWEEIQFFKPASEHKSRHNCVLLPFDALIRAAEDGVAEIG